MQYTTHYNLNLPEGTDIVNPLIQDNPNYSAIDTALYDNKLRVIGNATHTKTGTNHAITLADSDIVAFKFVATGDYVTGDTFTVDGVTVTARVADGSTIPNGAFKINSTVMAVLDGTLLNLTNVAGSVDPDDIILSNGETVEDAIANLEDRPRVTVIGDGVKTFGDLLTELTALMDTSKIKPDSQIEMRVAAGDLANRYNFNFTTKAASNWQFAYSMIENQKYVTREMHIGASPKYISLNDNTYSDETSSTAPNGRIISLIY